MVMRAGLSALALWAMAGGGSGERAPRRPNLLLLFPDEWRWDWQSSRVGVNPADPLIDVRTPNFDALAASGTAFAHAYVATPLCAPSRAALALGREYDAQQVPSNSFDVPDGLVTHYRALRDVAGYHVMVSGKDDLTKHSGYGQDGSYRATELGYSAWDGRTPGKYGTSKATEGPFPRFLSNSSVTLPNGSKVECDPRLATGYRTYASLRSPPHLCAGDLTRPLNQVNALWAHNECFSNVIGLNITRSSLTCCLDSPKFGVCRTPLPLPDEMYEDNWVGRHALGMLEARPANKPWFMQVNWPGPHPPFIVDQSMIRRTANRTYPLPQDYNGPNQPGDNIEARRLYAAEIENLDDWFGKFVAAVNKLGDSPQTIICVSSDHGEMLGDHNDWGKSKPWEGSAHVPLACTGPPTLVKPSQVIHYPVSTMDLAATWLDFAGIMTRSGMTRVTSRSLRGVLNGTANRNRQAVLSGLGRNASGSGTPLFNWRMVVQRVSSPNTLRLADATRKNNTTDGTVLLKYICCESSCPGAPTSAGVVPSGEWQELLYNVDLNQDWAEMKPLATAEGSYWAAAASAMRLMLPTEFAKGCAHAVRPEPMGQKYMIEKGGTCLTVSSTSLHTAVTLAQVTSNCTVWTTDFKDGAIIMKSTEDSLMLKHNGTSMCAPSSRNGTIELGPSSSSAQFGFIFDATNGTLVSKKCPELCVAPASGSALRSALCTEADVQGFNLKLL